MFRHPKYYKELRKLRNRAVQSSRTDSPQSDQAISLRAHDGERERATGPGLKQQASSVKPQATQVSSDKHQAPSPKRQAPSRKRQAP
jgi:hypothetical protein